MKRLSLLLILLLGACTAPRKADVHLTVLDPGHFHAALVQKYPLEGVNDTVHVYAPDGPEVGQYLEAVAAYQLPWVEEVYLGSDYLEALPPAASRRKAVVLAGNNALKARYILEAVRKGYHVLSDKPMALTEADDSLLMAAYATAREQGLVILELMTERHDPLNIRTREQVRALGGILPGTAEAPAIEMESIHHFYKEVSGKPLVRPVWYYDTACQGEGIADVTTHLIDLVFWQCFPGQSVLPSDIQIIEASHYPTLLSPEQFRRSTQAESFPSSLHPDADGNVAVLSNGSITFCVKGVYVRMDIRWDFEGEPDRFQAVYRCEKGDITVLQDASTGYRRQLLVNGEDDTPDPGPGHEAHFSLVTQAFLNAVRGTETLPDYERDNTLAKYALTTKAVQLAR